MVHEKGVRLFYVETRQLEKEQWTLSEGEKGYVKDPEEFCSAQNQQKMKLIAVLGSKGVPVS